MKPTARTLAALRKQGQLAGVVERFNQYAGPFGKTFDLFGFIDLIALDTDRGTITGIQATSGANGASRFTKITTECVVEAQAWLACGGRIEVWAWRKLKLRRGSKAVRWRPLVREVTFADFQPLEAEPAA